ncbi:hypothetical protein DFQ27_006137, partial [Actinomortierella ambigua]
MVAHFCKEAKRGSGDAQLFVGWIYGAGYLIDRNENESFWWYLQAAQQGIVVAQLRVAQMYQQGLGVDKSDVQAARWYRRAAEGGDAEAQLQLGTMYAYGHVVKEDNILAVRWFRMAAAQEESEAQATLGLWMVGSSWLSQERNRRRDGALFVKAPRSQDCIPHRARVLALHSLLRQYPPHVKNGATLREVRPNAVGGGTGDHKDSKPLEASLLGEITEEAVHYKEVGLLQLAHHPDVGLG